MRNIDLIQVSTDKYIFKTDKKTLIIIRKINNEDNWKVFSKSEPENILLRTHDLTGILNWLRESEFRLI